MAHGTATDLSDDGLIQKFTVLLSAPRELWIVYFGKVMETAAYALFNAGLMLYLINDLRFSDEGAGFFVGLWAVMISFFTFLVGSLSDAIGIRKTLIFSFTLCAITRGLTAVLGDPILAPVLGLVPMSLGVAMTIPVMVAAARRFTNKRQRSMGFALLYVMMNVGFAIAGKLYDKVRNWMGEEGTFVIPGVGIELSVYETIFLIAAAFTVVGLVPCMAFMREGVEMPEEGDEVTFDTSAQAPAEGGPIRQAGQILKKTGAILAEVFREKAFYRFLLFLTIVVGVRMVFYHMHYTLPPWADRELGYGSRFGTAWGVLNPVMIIGLTPLVGALFSRVSSYRMIIVGTSVCALSCFLLVLPIDTFAFLVPTGASGPVKWFLDIDGDLAPLYFTLLIFAAAFSVGEALWSPRLYQYTASVAPKGREATYMGLSLLPMFFAKFIVGPMSGVLLGLYCPAEGARQSSNLWLVVAVMAVASPVLIMALRKFIAADSDEEEDLVPASGADGDEEVTP
ncbi:MAG: hypothetical protein DRI90_16215 [Deltaproteobacteria bacterium]|nr:MAG: hypothetical protein DRI90_16215 [Deltaproteobacteria bacterium]